MDVQLAATTFFGYVYVHIILLNNVLFCKRRGHELVNKLTSLFCLRLFQVCTSLCDVKKGSDASARSASAPFATWISCTSAL